jgi:hypothetical protein
MTHLHEEPCDAENGRGSVNNADTANLGRRRRVRSVDALFRVRIQTARDSLLRAEVTAAGDFERAFATIAKPNQTL